MTKADLVEENKRLMRELETHKLSNAVYKVELAAVREAVRIVLEPHGPGALALVERIASAMTARGF